VRDVVERHGGEIWFERERVRHQAFFRFCCRWPACRSRSPLCAFLRGDSRPEYYDFDLFARPTSAARWTTAR
jgi:DNA polymerase-3 subunit epsilon